MTVSNRLEALNREIDELHEKFCENCQEFDCDYCGYKVEGGEA